MLSLGALAFTTPWLLAALITLPALWFLLRLTPPAPRRQLFPALRLMLRLESEQETPARTPWWLAALRMAIIALIILAFAGPVLNPTPRIAGDGPLVVALDNGWSSAAGWDARLATLTGILEQAQREGRPAMLVGTAPDPAHAAPAVDAPSEILETLPSLLPKPWEVDRAEAARIVSTVPPPFTGIWLSDGLVAGDEEADGALAEALSPSRPVRRFAPDPAAVPELLSEPVLDGERLVLRMQRLDGEGEQARDVHAIGASGEVFATTRLRFDDGSRIASADLVLPLDLRNRIARLEMAPRRTAGDVVLFDERWRRQSVGIAGAPNTARDRPLLSETYFLERALTPFAEVRIAGISELLGSPISMLVLPDDAGLTPADRREIAAWLENGGVVVRFAGPRLASGADELVPVPLRGGDRRLGGALSWSQPLALRFPDEGPLAGIETSPDATVSRQVLAQPGPGLAAATLASLADGTPLVTWAQRGEGHLVLFHTSANTSWTSLPISGQFVEMLRRIMAMAPGTGGLRDGAYEPREVLGPSGRLEPPQRVVAPLQADQLAAVLPGPDAPPGLWIRAAENDEPAAEAGAAALNLQRAVTGLEPLRTSRATGPVETYAQAREHELGPWLLLLALLLALADLIVSLFIRGLAPRRLPMRLARSGAAGLLLVLAAAPLAAQERGAAAAVAAANETRLAYVRTGDRAIDELSRAGLDGLTRTLLRRTSIDAAQPVGISLESPELALYPLLYWPIPEDHPALSEPAVEALERYLDNGGMVLIDTKDAGLLFPGQQGGGPGERRLGELLGGLDLPPLEPLPPDHVLTRSFYLLQDLPGRWTGQPVWVDLAREDVNDGVSSLVIGAHDWVGAWAEDEYGRYLLPVVPGGEDQREMARRFGVNLVMYALTGNYKTDQVHVPALLERLGQ